MSAYYIFIVQKLLEVYHEAAAELDSDAMDTYRCLSP